MSGVQHDMTNPEVVETATEALRRKLHQANVAISHAHETVSGFAATSQGYPAHRAHRKSPFGSTRQSPAKTSLCRSSGHVLHMRVRENWDPHRGLNSGIKRNLGGPYIPVWVFVEANLDP